MFQGLLDRWEEQLPKDAEGDPVYPGEGEPRYAFSSELVDLLASDFQGNLNALRLDFIRFNFPFPSIPHFLIRFCKSPFIDFHSSRSSLKFVRFILLPSIARLFGLNSILHSI